MAIRLDARAAASDNFRARRIIVGGDPRGHLSIGMKRIFGENGKMERTTLTERLRRAEAEIAAGRSEQALAYCQELQTAYPRALRVQRVLGQVYLALRRPREALAALDRALAGDPEDVRACCARALVHQMHGDERAALAWYGRACDLRPDDQSLRATYRDLARRLGEPPYRPSRAGLARLYMRGDLFSHAIREWEQLVIERPDRLDAQVGLAETLWLAGHARAAEERCRRILANAPSCVKAMLLQMALALAEGDMDAARAHLERTLQLDPDMAIAHICFADALAAGDPVMTALLRPSHHDAAAEETAKISRPTAGFAQSDPLAGQRNLSRPLVTSAPVAEPAFVVTQQTNQPLPPPPRPDIPVPSQPTEVTRAFRETAFMIWGQDDDSQPRIPAQHASAADDGSVVPPTLRELASAADDEETRRALNWYNWLQSQGAVTLGRGTAGPAARIPPPPPPPMPGRGAGAPPNGPAEMPGGMENNNRPASVPEPAPKLTVPIPPFSPPAPSSQARSTMPFPPAQPTIPLVPTEPQEAPLGDSDEQETTVLPLPSPDALRTMFAELGGNTAGPPVVVPHNEPQPEFAPTRADETDAGGDTDILSVPSWSAPSVPLVTPAVPAMQDRADVVEAPSQPENPFGAFATSQRDEMPDASMPAAESDEPSSDPETIEELERQFAASGFTPIAPRPGLLAEIEREHMSAPGTSSMPNTPNMPNMPNIPNAPNAPDVPDTPERASAAQPEAAVDRDPAVSAPAPRAPVPSGPKATGPDPRDYPARLAHARQRRGDGQLDEALNEYRAIIKNAPDLLPEVLSDLRASLDEMPDHSSLHSVLGDALVSQGEYEKALESYNRATELAQSHSGRP